MKRIIQRLRNTGLATHGATVAFTPARAVTSHLRRRYRKHYVPRFRFPRIVFALDLTIFLCAIFLIALQVALFVSLPPRPAPLGLTFTSGPVISASPVTLVATVSSRDGRVRENLTLEWQLPESTEILNADPVIAKDNSVYLGRLEPGQTVESRLIVRLYAPIGDANIGFRVHDIDGYLTGDAQRRIESSAIKLEPLFPGSPALRDGKIPYRVQNASDQSIDGVTMLNAEPANLETLYPNQDKIVFVSPGSRVSALVRAVPLVEAQAQSAPVTSSASLRLLESAGSRARFNIQSEESGIVRVYHPGIAHPHVKSFSVPVGETVVNINLDRATLPGEAWYAVFEGAGGQTNIELSKISTSFEVSASARYYASTGDQIGIGPIPPRVGEETKYWVQLKIAPTQSDIADIKVMATLGNGVAPTGRSALPSGGGISQSSDQLVWSIPYLASSENGAEARFEVSITPSSSDRGKSMLLIANIDAMGTEVQSGNNLNAASGYVDTFLFGDEKAAGRGIVE
ncbi:hypothetical protein IT407_04810 [Candidatus Uhrbacteria bacterium]|nr:hypothetical protein [Candidatus Uhrbacteria bacterium]